MNRLSLALAFILVIALAATAVARAPNAPAPPGNAYGAYGCCCPWSAHLGICPVTPGALLKAFDDVCEIHEDGSMRYCNPGEEGVYPYRGMTLRQIAIRLHEWEVIADPKVSAILGFLCGHDWDKWVP